jgi:hypothetical protein
MRIKSALTAALLLAAAAPARAELGSWSVTMLPAASVRYRGEGKVLPQSYVNRFDGETSPVYRLELSQRADPAGYWSLALWHTGVFGGGAFARERVPDNTTGGVYQENLLNVGYTNAFATYHRGLEGLPVEAQVSLSVVRQIFKRKDFVVQGADFRGAGFDDVNEISAEGLGFGLAGRHALPGPADRFYARWQANAHYYVQIFDAQTDSHAGQIFLAEAGLGARVFAGLSVEAGGHWQYWFTHGQGNRRIEAPDGSGAVISWNRQETRTAGFYVRTEYRFAKGEDR